MKFSLMNWMESSNVKLLKKSLLFTLLWGTIHAYGFLNFTISHDSLEALYSGNSEIEWKLSIGRIFVTIYRQFTRGLLTTPWLIGLIALLWIGLSVCFITRIFDQKSSCFIALTAGIMTVNPVVTALSATFLHDLDIDMFALFLGVLTVYLWKEYRWGIYTGIFFVSVILGLYQSYLSVVITLIIIVSIMSLLEGTACKKVVLKGIRGILMVLGGSILYLLYLQIFSWITGVSLNSSYNSMGQLFIASDSSFFWNIIKTYYYWAMYFVKPITLYPVAFITAGNIILVFCILSLVLPVILGRKMTADGKLLLMALGVLLPLGMNISYVMSKGILHGLMKYAFCFIYILTLLLADWGIKNIDDGKGICRGRFVKAVTVAMVALMIWNCIPVANAAYLKKDLERQQTLSLMTRVVSQMEGLEDYESGKTEVMFAGKINLDEMPGFEIFDGDGNVTGVQGLTANDQIKNYRDYEAYFRYILNISINLCSEARRAELWNTEMVKAMPVFPEKGCMEFVNKTLVIKMGDIY